MSFIKIDEQSRLEVLLIRLGQGVLFNLYLVLYLCTLRVAHRAVVDLEEAVISQPRFHKEIDQGQVKTCQHPSLHRLFGLAL